MERIWRANEVGPRVARRMAARFAGPTDGPSAQIVHFAGAELRPVGGALSIDESAYYGRTGRRD